MNLEKSILNLTNLISSNLTEPIIGLYSNLDSIKNEVILNSENNEYSNIKLVSTIGIICNIFQPLIYLAPIKCFYRMIIERETKKIPIYYFIFNIIQNLIWILVSTTKLDFAILVANIVSAVFFIVFFVGFLIISSKNELFEIMAKINTTVFLIIAILFCGYNYLNFSLNASIAIIMETTCYLSILQFLKNVFEFEDPSYIDLPIVASIFLVNFWWVIYSLLQYNMILFIPNFIGLITSTTVLYINYHFSIKKGIKETVKIV
jgi:solute carrier family 50 protein (sugar transporter)